MTSDLVHLAATARHMPMTDVQSAHRRELQTSRWPLFLRRQPLQLGRQTSSREFPVASRVETRPGT